ncbi:MAG: hypothetical protein WA510_29700 [Acidobacteriaceae bacterium]
MKNAQAPRQQAVPGLGKDQPGGYPCKRDPGFNQRDKRRRYYDGRENRTAECAESRCSG